MCEREMFFRKDHYNEILEFRKRVALSTTEKTSCRSDKFEKYCFFSSTSKSFPFFNIHLFRQDKCSIKKAIKGRRVERYIPGYSFGPLSISVRICLTLKSLTGSG